MAAPTSPSPAADPQALNRHLAAQLRALRCARNWSLDRAASETGVSKAMLGQIERGESSPTVATLWKIASGLQCPLSAFLVAPPTQSDAALFRSADALREKPASDDMLVAPLFPYEPRFAFEWLELTLLPGYVRHSEAHAAGVTEHVLLISGSMEVLVDGDWLLLREGEAVRFAGDRAHGYRNLGATAAVCHNLIHYAGEVASLSPVLDRGRHESEGG
ncbi:helix-turn-helix domain-containing protein [Rhodocyclus tenuis]|uniref:Transcriptional regulator with XRE-family HTH domain n=1 Tax=Rhodocyclus tenuis TaxID=1066 RepID=A0A840FZW0_RHOTE|nr:helix-turn-helix domain-containing protein [Rhodocyclus tenuis]MBB4247667.1 transcriptional regulator with XRE-family HTH domain [Rhodocyclus tenuis]